MGWKFGSGDSDASSVATGETKSWGDLFGLGKKKKKKAEKEEKK